MRKLRISNSQILNAAAILSALALFAEQQIQSGALHVPSWVLPVLTIAAGLSRSLLPSKSGVPGQQANVAPTATPNVKGL